MARGRRVLTAVAAFGMVLAIAAAPAEARRGADSGSYEPDHGGGGPAGGAYTEGGGTGGGTYTEGGGARQGSAPEGSVGEDSATKDSATKDSEGGKKAGDLADVCENVFGSEPTGDLTIRTSPPDGATVRPGQEIEVTLKWDAGMLGGPELHGWANCVTVDDVVRPDLSAGGGNGANDGSLSVGVKVPDTVKAGSELCTQAVVVGQHGDDVSAQRRDMREEANLEEAMSECLCYTVAAPVPAPPPPPPPRQPEDIFPPPPPPQVLPAGEPAPPQVLPAVERRPEATLPRTGPSRALLLLAGVALLLGGLAVMGGAQAEPLPSRVRR